MIFFMINIHRLKCIWFLLISDLNKLQLSEISYFFHLQNWKIIKSLHYNFTESWKNIHHSFIISLAANYNKFIVAVVVVIHSSACSGKQNKITIFFRLKLKNFTFLKKNIFKGHFRICMLQIFVPKDLKQHKL